MLQCFSLLFRVDLIKILVIIGFKCRLCFILEFSAGEEALRRSLLFCYHYCGFSSVLSIIGLFRLLDSLIWPRLIVCDIRLEVVVEANF